jgi:8-oxo-dGTP pyrophosphatase MutT (NUDIX family)
VPESCWTLLRSRILGDYKILRLREDQYRFEPSGAESPFVVCESADWVLVIALTAEEQLVLIRQFRHGVRQTVLEVPGGVLDEGETPESAAARELREETGYVPERVRSIGRMMPNPAINNAFLHVVLAEGCRPTAEQQLDPFEQIEIELHPQAEIAPMIRDGRIVHALVIAALALWQGAASGNQGAAGEIQGAASDDAGGE